NDTTTVAAAFKSSKIVPDVVPSFDPLYPLLVTFKQADGSSIQVTAGIQLTIARESQCPTYFIRSPVLITVDPDAPTPQDPSVAQVRHFLAPDFVSDGTGPLTNRTPALSPYIGPQPPAGSHAHRFV
ncbi:PEBP-like protein, partial [Exidia glandulosa HHB12029]